MTRRTDRDVAAIEGTPWELAERLRLLIEQGEGTMAEQRIIMHRLASDFGARRGWLYAPRRAFFSYEALARGRGRAPEYFPPAPDSPCACRLFDHHFYYWRHRTPAAIAVHPYGVRTPECRANCIAHAAAHGLAAEFPDDFPSWWYPGATTLVVLTRAGAHGKGGNQ